MYSLARILTALLLLLPISLQLRPQTLPATIPIATPDHRVHGHIFSVFSSDKISTVLTDGTLYQFPSDTPEKWTAVAYLGTNYLDRILAADADSCLFLGGITKDGIVEPALFRWTKANQKTKKICDLPSDKCAFLSSTIGSVLDNQCVLITTDAAKHWSPPLQIVSDPQQTLDNLRWITDTDFIASDTAGYFYRCRIKDGLHILWTIHPLTYQARFTTAATTLYIDIGSTPDALSEYNLDDGQPQGRITLPLNPGQLVVTERFILAWDEKLSITALKDSAVVLPPTDINRFCFPLKISKDQILLAFGDASIIQITPAKPTMEPFPITCDNSLYHAALAKLHENDPTPQEMGETFRHLDQIPPDQAKKLAEQVATRPGTGREKNQWLSAQLKLIIQSQKSTTLPSTLPYHP